MAEEQKGITETKFETEATKLVKEELKEASVKKSKDFRDIVRIRDKDVSGNNSIYLAIAKAKGVSFMFSNAVCNVLGINKSRKAGDFSVPEIEQIEEVIKDPKKAGIPSWLFNRRGDSDTGEDLHLSSSDLTLRKEFDIRNMKKIKSYRGMRHARGLRVRGQRTRSTGRRGATLGVARKKKSGKK